MAESSAGTEIRTETKHFPVRLAVTLRPLTEQIAGVLVLNVGKNRESAGTRVSDLPSLTVVGTSGNVAATFVYVSALANVRMPFELAR